MPRVTQPQKNLRQLRTEREWTQAQLAAMIGRNQSTIAHWENGANGLPDRKDLHELARVFRLSEIEICAALLRSGKRKNSQQEPVSIAL